MGGRNADIAGFRAHQHLLDPSRVFISIQNVTCQLVSPLVSVGNVKNSLKQSQAVSDIFRIFLGYFQDISRIFLGYFQDISRIFLGYF